jgi:hypothetical protein
MTTKKDCAGAYVVTVRGATHQAEVVRYRTRNGDGFNGWVARVRGDKYAFSDPLPTKRDAVWAAIQMLTEDRP